MIPVKDPTSDLAVGAARGSKIVRHYRDTEDRKKVRVVYRNQNEGRHSQVWLSLSEPWRYELSCSVHGVTPVGRYELLRRK